MRVFSAHFWELVGHKSVVYCLECTKNDLRECPQTVLRACSARENPCKGLRAMTCPTIEHFLPMLYCSIRVGRGTQTIQGVFKVEYLMNKPLKNMLCPQPCIFCVVSPLGTCTSTIPYTWKYQGCLMYMYACTKYHTYWCWLTLGAHVQEGYCSWVCVWVSVCVLSHVSSLECGGGHILTCLCWIMYYFTQ